MDLSAKIKTHGPRLTLLLFAASLAMLPLARAQSTSNTKTPPAKAPEGKAIVPIKKLPNPKLSPEAALPSAQQIQPVPPGATAAMLALRGLTVSAIEFHGVSAKALAPLPSRLPQQPGKPLNPTSVRQSLRRLFSTGLYRDIRVEGLRHGRQVTLIFTGTPSYFIGHVIVSGIKNPQLSSRISYAPGLSPGTLFTNPKISDATSDIEDALKQNGFYLGKVFHSVTVDKQNRLKDVHFFVETGPRAHIGNVTVQGDSGMSTHSFRKRGKLQHGSKVNHDTVGRALTRLRKHYQKNHHLEATVQLKSTHFQPKSNHLNYDFVAQKKSTVKIEVDGVNLSRGKIRKLVPVYQEGDVDEDLLNEGNKLIKDYYQRRGYFNVKVSHTRATSATQTTITYKVTLGIRSAVTKVSVSGNHYFSNSTLLSRLSVKPKTFFIRHGLYSEDLTESDSSTIEALYQMNGFTNVNVTPQVKQTYGTRHHRKVGYLAVNYAISEGKQHKFGKISISGNHQVSSAKLSQLIFERSGQPYNPNEVQNDRDSLLSYYLSHGFDHAEVTPTQTNDPQKPDLINIHFQIIEGNQTFIRKVLISGLHYTKRSTVQPHILVHPGQPLDRNALRSTQRELYNLTLFNEVNTAVENPKGQEPRKNLLIQLQEARRWNVTYGFGLQAQTGTPSNNCPSPATYIELGLTPPSNLQTNCSPTGKFGVSPLVEFDVARSDLFGTDQSITLQTKYGTLEQLAEITYDHPHLLHRPGLSFSISGGYSNTRDVTTYTASRLEGNFRVTQHPSRADTLIYQFTFRRVKVDAATVQVSPNLIPLLSQPVRVGGPEITWIHDTRRPQPLNAKHGWYNNVQEFLADNKFASEANFNRFEWNNSSYYTFPDKLTIARNTTFGFERAFGNGAYEQIPLPERFFAGGAQSLRAYGLNQAGPRDSLTGFPIGGAALFVNQTEFRLPHPTLPFVGNSLGFVIFHDMGNVFNSSSDIWPSFLRIRQPHTSTCRDLNPQDQDKRSRHSSTNPTGTCSFNYFTHDIGLGLRYSTPIGPIRLDFSYTLNPPIYPVIYTNSTCAPPPGGTSPNYICPGVDQAPHFNFFFSIGQAF